MQAAGVEPDVQCYNVLIRACAAGGDIEGLSHWLRDMHRNGFTPDPSTYAPCRVPSPRLGRGLPCDVAWCTALTRRSGT